MRNEKERKATNLNTKNITSKKLIIAIISEQHKQLHNQPISYKLDDETYNY
jgi:hypothetical protein